MAAVEGEDAAADRAAVGVERPQVRTAAAARNGDDLVAAAVDVRRRDVDAAGEVRGVGEEPAAERGAVGVEQLARAGRRPARRPPRSPSPFAPSKLPTATWMPPVKLRIEGEEPVAERRAVGGENPHVRAAVGRGAGDDLVAGDVGAHVADGDADAAAEVGGRRRRTRCPAGPGAGVPSAKKTRTCGPPPAPAAVTISSPAMSGITSPTATSTPPRKLGAVGVEADRRTDSSRREHPHVRAAARARPPVTISWPATVAVEFADSDGVAAAEAGPVRRGRLRGEPDLRRRITPPAAVGDRHAGAHELRGDRVGRWSRNPARSAARPPPATSGAASEVPLAIAVTAADQRGDQRVAGRGDVDPSGRAARTAATRVVLHRGGDRQHVVHRGRVLRRRRRCRLGRRCCRRRRRPARRGRTRG